LYSGVGFLKKGIAKNKVKKTKTQSKGSNLVQSSQVAAQRSNLLTRSMKKFSLEEEGNVSKPMSLFKHTLSYSNLFDHSCQVKSYFQ
jgi:hypothetical protein